ncbi:hypothetical protein PAXRUDRAFT_127892, partial [Paxillus rubicundulus Ve08.2h10]
LMQTRGCSRSAAMSRCNSMEQVPTDSEDKGTALPPQGPLPTCDYCTNKELMCGPGSGAACCHCKRRKTKCSLTTAQRAQAKLTKHGRSASHPSAKPMPLRPQSQAPLPLKKLWSSKMHQVVGLSRPHHEKFDGTVIPFPSHSFAWSSIPPSHQSMQPKANPSTLLVSKDEDIANLQAQVLILEQKVANLMHNTQMLSTVVEAL